MYVYVYIFTYILYEQCNAKVAPFRYFFSYYPVNCDFTHRTPSVQQ